MSFPIYADKHTRLSTPLVTPERSVQAIRDRGLLDGYVPPPHQSVGPYPGQLHLLDRFGGRVGVMAFFGTGAPAVATAIDTLAAAPSLRTARLHTTRSPTRALGWSPPAAPRFRNRRVEVAIEIIAAEARVDQG